MTDLGDGAIKLVLITGPSGAGRSTAIHALEDLGFEAIDNIPLSLIPRLLDSAAVPRQPMALGIDVRNRDFSVDGLLKMRRTLAQMAGGEPDLVYLDCRQDVLVRRFSETRRRHPMAPQDSPDQGVRAEVALLHPLLAKASHLIDTSDLSPHDLRAEMNRWYASQSGGGLAVTVMSFSYKRGLPRGADIVLDCRFLKNPHWQPELRPLTGRASEVGDFISRDPRFAGFARHTRDMLDHLLPAFVDEGKTHLSVAFGCTGGQHRSVFVTEYMAHGLAETGWQVAVRHKELERRGILQDSKPAPPSDGALHA